MRAPAFDPISVVRSRICRSQKLPRSSNRFYWAGAFRTDIPHPARGSSAFTLDFCRPHQRAMRRLYATKSTDYSRTKMLLLAPRGDAQFLAPPIRSDKRSKQTGIFCAAHREADNVVLIHDDPNAWPFDKSLEDCLMRNSNLLHLLGRQMILPHTCADLEDSGNISFDSIANDDRHFKPIAEAERTAVPMGSPFQCFVPESRLAESTPFQLVGSRPPFRSLQQSLPHPDTDMAGAALRF